MGKIFIESSIPMSRVDRIIFFLTNLNPALQNLLHIPLSRGGILQTTLSFLQ